MIFGLTKSYGMALQVLGAFYGAFLFQEFWRIEPIERHCKRWRQLIPHIFFFKLSVAFSLVCAFEWKGYTEVKGLETTKWPGLMNTD